MATEASSDWSTPVKFTVAGELWPSIEYGKLLASDGTAGAGFGAACALSATGDLALIGAGYDDDKGDYAGAVYVFTRTENVWTQQQKLLASDGKTMSYFGAAVALNAAGDLALIGAYGDDTKGSVYVFTRSGNVWTQQQKLITPDGAPGDHFGVSCSLNNDASIALVGALGDDDKGNKSGSVYVFTRSGTVWTQQQKLYTTDIKENAQTGSGVALNAAGDLALVGARSSSTHNDLGRGSVYVFTRSGTVWTQQQKLLASDGVAGAGFGQSVTLNSDASIALIGAAWDSSKGTVYVFTRSGTVWTQQQKLISSDAAINDFFGISAALNAAGDLALIGALYDDDKGLDSGSVYVFS